MSLNNRYFIKRTIMKINKYFLEKNNPVKISPISNPIKKIICVTGLIFNSAQITNINKIKSENFIKSNTANGINEIKKLSVKLL